MLGAPLRARVLLTRGSASRRWLAVPLLVAALGAVSVPAATAAAAASPAAVSATTSGSQAQVSDAHAPAHSTHLSLAAKRAAFGRSIMHEAARHQGVPYVYGASGPGAFDCSGFTSYVFRQMGIFLPHTSYGQYAMVEHISHWAALPGDLIFLNGLGHVAIYAGHGMMWDAPSPGGHVSERPIYSSSYVVGRVRL